MLFYSAENISGYFSEAIQEADNSGFLLNYRLQGRVLLRGRRQPRVGTRVWSGSLATPNPCCLASELPCSQGSPFCLPQGYNLLTDQCPKRLQKGYNFVLLKCNVFDLIGLIRHMTKVCPACWFLPFLMWLLGVRTWICGSHYSSIRWPDSGSHPNLPDTSSSFGFTQKQSTLDGSRMKAVAAGGSPHRGCLGHGGGGPADIRLSTWDLAVNGPRISEGVSKRRGRIRARAEPVGRWLGVWESGLCLCVMGLNREHRACQDPWVSGAPPTPHKTKSSWVGCQPREWSWWQSSSRPWLCRRKDPVRPGGPDSPTGWGRHSISQEFVILLQTFLTVNSASARIYQLNCFGRQSP